MDLNKTELKEHPLHFTSLNAAILASLNPKHHYTYFVNEKGERAHIINGRVLTIVDGDGNTTKFTDKIKVR